VRRHLVAFRLRLLVDERPCRTAREAAHDVLSAPRRHRGARVGDTRGDPGLRHPTFVRTLVGGLDLAFRTVTVGDTTGECTSRRIVVPRHLAVEIVVAVVVSDLDRLAPRVDTEEPFGPL